MSAKHSNRRKWFVVFMLFIGLYMLIYNDSENNLFITRVFLDNVDDASYLGLRNLFPGRKFRVKIRYVADCEKGIYNKLYVDYAPNWVEVRQVDYNVTTIGEVDLINKTDAKKLELNDAIVVINGELDEIYYIYHGYNENTNYGYVKFKKSEKRIKSCKVYFMRKSVSDSTYFIPED